MGGSQGATPGSGEQDLLQEPGCRGPALGMEDRQLDPLGQLLSSRERLQPSGHRRHLGAAGLKAFEGEAGGGSGGSKRPLHLLLVSWTRPFEAEMGVAPIHNPQSSPHMTSCSGQSAKDCLILRGAPSPHPGMPLAAPPPSSLSPLDTDPTKTFLTGFITSLSAVPSPPTQPNNSPMPEATPAARNAKTSATCECQG